MAPLQWTQGLEKLWSEYVQKNQPARQNSKTEKLEWSAKKNGQYVRKEQTIETFELSYNGRTMRYTVDIFGPQPDDGYPVYIGLHGGGGPDLAEFEKLNQDGQKARRESNDEAWCTMYQHWYNLGVRDRFKYGNSPGVYIAPRGITETWDLHFQPETYILLQQLIRNLLLPQPIEAKSTATKARTFADSNRIYLMGFSAGGDGVYRLSTRLADCFGAVNMSGGHPGEVKLFNLANLPICLQVGENDNEHNLKRMALTAKSSIELYNHAASMEKIDPSKKYFIHDCFIHPGQGHSNWRNKEGHYDAQDILNNNIDVVARDKNSLEKYYARNENGIDPFGEATDALDNNVNTGAISWVSQYPRTPLPAYVVWHLGSRPARPEPLPLSTEWEPKRFFYWLMIHKDDDTNKYNKDGFITASYDKSDNSVWVRCTGIKVTILLNNQMLDLKQPIKVFLGYYKRPLGTITGTESAAIQKMTLDARGDPNFVFSAALSIDPNLDNTRVIDGVFGLDTNLKAKL